MSASRGPRDWSPRMGTIVYVVMKDTPNGYDVEIFKKEKDAYKYMTDSALPWVHNRFDNEEADQWKALVKKGEYEEAFNFYHEILDSSALEKMPYYSVVEKELL